MSQSRNVDEWRTIFAIISRYVFGRSWLETVFSTRAHVASFSTSALRFNFVCCIHFESNAAVNCAIHRSLLGEWLMAELSGFAIELRIDWIRFWVRRSEDNRAFSSPFLSCTWPSVMEAIWVSVQCLLEPLAGNHRWFGAAQSSWIRTERFESRREARLNYRFLRKN